MIEVKERPKARSDRMALHIRKVGVIGAGQMGNGIAHVCALAGFDVKLNDLSADRIKAGIATINGNMARQVSRKRITEEERAGRAQAHHASRPATTPSAIAISSSRRRPRRRT